MTHIFLIAHAPLASALQAVAAHVYPECAPGIVALDVPPGESPEAVQSWLQRQLDQLDRRGPAEALVMVDAFGATPCNAATRVADGVRVRVVAGVNVPMLWRTLCYRHEALDRLVDRAIAGGTQGVMHVAVPRRQNQSTAGTSSAHDQVDHPHQQ